METLKNQSAIRVLFIYPPSSQTHQSCPMGMQMLSAVLEKAGHKPYLLDACAAKKHRTIEEIVEFAVNLKPDVIGLTLLTPAVRNSYKLASALKSKGFKIIAGGPHATLMPQEVISHNFDAVVIGEGEPVIIPAIQSLLGQFPPDQIPGWAYKNSQNQPVFTGPREFVADLDSLPLPARHLVDKSEYGKSNEHGLFSNIFSSRGCPARCSFCAGGLFGKHFRFRSAQNIIDEICLVHKTYGTSHFHFVDDAMTVNDERIKEFCESMKNLKLPITWSIMTRIDTVDEDLLKLLSSAGCNQIDYGVESGFPETLKKIHKPHTVEMVRKIIPLTAKYKIKPFVFFILGFPWESADDIDVTYSLMKELAPYIECFHPAVASILVPFPGTEIYQTYKNEYGFENWWLSDDRHYENTSNEKLSFYEKRMFRYGHVLQADFFHYGEAEKAKIREIFAFMYKHNLRSRSLASRLILSSLFSISKNLARVSPALEKSLFSYESIIKKIIY